jgi:hypothetical protein
MAETSPHVLRLYNACGRRLTVLSAVVKELDSDMHIDGVKSGLDTMRDSIECIGNTLKRPDHEKGDVSSVVAALHQTCLLADASVRKKLVEALDEKCVTRASMRAQAHFRSSSTQVDATLDRHSNGSKRLTGLHSMLRTVLVGLTAAASYTGRLLSWTVNAFIHMLLNFSKGLLWLLYRPVEVAMEGVRRGTQGTMRLFRKHWRKMLLALFAVAMLFATPYLIDYCKGQPDNDKWVTAMNRKLKSCTEDLKQFFQSMPSVVDAIVQTYVDVVVNAGQFGLETLQFVFGNTLFKPVTFLSKSVGELQSNFNETFDFLADTSRWKNLMVGQPHAAIPQALRTDLPTPIVPMTLSLSNSLFGLLAVTATREVYTQATKRHRSQRKRHRPSSRRPTAPRRPISDRMT